MCMGKSYFLKYIKTTLLENDQLLYNCKEVLYQRVWVTGGLRTVT